jgi:hypothetical protein
MKIVNMEVGNLGTNCYIVYSGTTHSTAVINPGGNTEEIIAFLRGEKLTVDYIILDSECTAYKSSKFASLWPLFCEKKLRK